MKSKKTKNKKAEITLENTLTVILAALGLIILAAGAYKLYQVVVGQEQENAKNFLNVLEAKINALEDGESNIFSIRGVKPKLESNPWFLTGWGKDDPKRAKDKIECFLDSCICVCQGSKTDLAETCNKGYCKKIGKEKINVTSVILAKEIAIEEYRPLKEVLVNYITLPKNLIALQINKTTSEIIITKVS